MLKVSHRTAREECTLLQPARMLVIAPAAICSSSVTCLLKSRHQGLQRAKDSALDLDGEKETRGLWRCLNQQSVLYIEHVALRRKLL